MACLFLEGDAFDWGGDGVDVAGLEGRVDVAGSASLGSAVEGDAESEGVGCA